MDVRPVLDRENDLVFDHWPLGRQALGRNDWRQTLRIALRETTEAPWTAAQCKLVKPDVERVLRQHGIRAVVVVQTASVPGVRQTHAAWNMLGHGGNPYKWAGTAERVGDWFVCPILHPYNYEAVYAPLLSRWVKQAHALAAGTLEPLVWPTLWTHPSASALCSLQEMSASEAIAVDIETNMAGTVITAIGLSDGLRTVSVPWHEYVIAGSDGEVQRALDDYPRGEEIHRAVSQILSSPRQKKILHNGTFDVLQLAKHGITLAGFECDTLLAHRVVYPQYRHGLQQACATEFCVEPWKCLFKPPKVAGADEWCGDPAKLREYNARDTYATWQLWKHLEPKLG
jgi:hypothetical protein